MIAILAFMRMSVSKCQSYPLFFKLNIMLVYSHTAY